MRRDFRSEPVRSMVVMGESNAYGMCATDPQNEWVQVVASQIRRHQDGYLRVLNNAIPSNVISPKAPVYQEFSGAYATAPSALERYATDMIAYEPDLAIYAYGLNDSLCGHEADSFLHDYETVVSETRRELPETLIVLVGPYWNPPHDLKLWSEHRFDDVREQRRALYGYHTYGPDLITAYNEGIRGIAARFDSLYVDIYRLLEGAHWLIHADACHFTDVGQATIGMAVFASLAVNCSFLSLKSAAVSREGGFATRDTGGTNALPSVVSTWRYYDDAQPPDHPQAPENG